MPSIVSGFEYDIFISYRHNDNRSGWVTEFVKALQEELATTIKEPVSVYFDLNPHDKLLNTHDVDGFNETEKRNDRSISSSFHLLTLDSLYYICL